MGTTCCQDKINHVMQIRWIKINIKQKYLSFEDLAFTQTDSWLKAESSKNNTAHKGIISYYTRLKNKNLTTQYIITNIHNTQKGALNTEKSDTEETYIMLVLHGTEKTDNEETYIMLVLHNWINRYKVINQHKKPNFPTTSSLIDHLGNKDAKFTSWAFPKPTFATHKKNFINPKKISQQNHSKLNEPRSNMRREKGDISSLRTGQKHIFRVSPF